MDPAYLAWFVRYEGPTLAALGQGSTFSAITRGDVEDLEFPLPGLTTQRRISTELSKQFALASEASDVANERREAVGLLRRRVLDETIASAVATGPKCRLLRDVLKSRNEIIHPRDHPSGDALFVGLEHIESDTGNRLGGQTIRLQDLTGRKARFHAGDIVYGYLRPYLNKVWLADSRGFCSVDQYVFKVDPSVADAD